MQLKRVVITGLGGITPLGNSVTEFWNNLIKGVSGAANITRFNAEKFKTRFACEVKGFNIEDYFDKKEARKLDAYSQYGIAASVQAVADSGIAGDSIDKKRSRCYLGFGHWRFRYFSGRSIWFCQRRRNTPFQSFLYSKNDC